MPAADGPAEQLEVGVMPPETEVEPQRQPRVLEEDERFTLEKPLHGAPCNGCGLCCRTELCVVGHKVFGRWEGPCPALEPEEGGRFVCGVLRNPRKYAPVRAAKVGNSKLRAATATLMGPGLGCDVWEVGGYYDVAFGEFMKRRKAEMRPEQEKAYALWGIDPLAQHVSFRRFRDGEE
jgi:hypothetical protein